jgi:hypothetical protein
MKEEYGILVIHTDKQTGEYQRFEIYPRKIEKDLPTQVEKWNKNAEMKTFVKVYDDPLLACLAEDVCSSRSRDSLISELRDIARDINDTARRLDCISEEIIDELEDKEE